MIAFVGRGMGPFAPFISDVFTYLKRGGLGASCALYAGISSKSPGRMVCG